MDPERPASIDAVAPPEAPTSPHGGTAPDVPPRFELPTARQLVGRGFDLGVASSGQIGRASIYVGLLSAALVVPVLIQVAAVAVTFPEELRALFDADGELPIYEPGGAESAEPTPVVLLWTVLSLASVAITALMIDAQAMAISLLGGRLSGRPMRLHEALRRARQVFWRMVMVGLLVSLPLAAIQSLLTDPLVATGIPAEGAVVLVGILMAVLGAPFGYVPAGIILGDVEPGQAVLRSIRLARTRWRLALVIALFATVFAWIELLAFGVGIGVLARLGDAVHLGFDSTLATAVTMLVLLAGVAGGVSLIFTFGALIAAPQVVAFVGLTHFHAGLDRARDPAPPSVSAPAAAEEPPPATVSGWAASSGAPATFRWVTLPMVAILIVEVVLALSGLAGALSPQA